jgi:hydrogenase/urease accessory protein HupE
MWMKRALGSIAALLSLWASAGTAHELRPGYLQLRETGLDSYAVFWKVPGRGDLKLAIAPKFPDNCASAAASSIRNVDEAFVEHTLIRCAGGLAGGTIAISGLEATLTDALVRIESRNGKVQTARLTAAQPSFVLEMPKSWLAAAATYTRLGIEHILLGIDHLLFILALLILVRTPMQLVGTITAFTIAHSITLAVSTLGYVHLRASVIEALIAFSIVALAVEVANLRRGHTNLAAQFPWVVAFGFGLLHGFGFANALAALGLPASDIPLALLFFNVGVELGQLAFVVAALAIAAAARRILVLPREAALVPAYAIGSVAAFWFLERLQALGS